MSPAEISIVPALPVAVNAELAEIREPRSVTGSPGLLDPASTMRVGARITIPPPFPVDAAELDKRDPSSNSKIGASTMTLPALPAAFEFAPTFTLWRAVMRSVARNTTLPPAPVAIPPEPPEPPPPAPPPPGAPPPGPPPPEPPPPEPPPPEPPPPGPPPPPPPPAINAPLELCRSAALTRSITVPSTSIDPADAAPVVNELIRTPSSLTWSPCRSTLPAASELAVCVDRTTLVPLMSSTFAASSRMSPPAPPLQPLHGAVVSVVPFVTTVLRG